jgi:hypothetical protein
MNADERGLPDGDCQSGTDNQSSSADVADLRRFLLCHSCARSPLDPRSGRGQALIEGRNPSSVSGGLTAAPSTAEVLGAASLRSAATKVPSRQEREERQEDQTATHSNLCDLGGLCESHNLFQFKDLHCTARKCLLRKQDVAPLQCRRPQRRCNV